MPYRIDRVLILIARFNINPLLKNDNKDNIKDKRKQGFSYEVDNPGQRPKGSGERLFFFARVDSGLMVVAEY